MDTCKLISVIANFTKIILNIGFISHILLRIFYIIPGFVSLNAITVIFMKVSDFTILCKIYHIKPKNNIIINLLVVTNVIIHIRLLI